MKVPDNPKLIETGTITLDGETYPMLGVQIMAGKYSEEKLLMFNWTLVSFASRELLI